MSSTVILVVILAAAVGGALGWFLGCRPVADWKARHAERDGAAREHEENFKRAVTELADARIELATLKANADNFDRQMQLMKEARDDLLAQFKVAGGEVLTKAQEEFLKRAEEKFGHAEKANKEAVKALLQPVHERLKTYEDHVTSLEQKRVTAFGELTGLIASMREGQEQVPREAQEIGRMGAELYERLRVAADHLKRVGGGLETAVNNYNKFVGSFERNVLSSGKRLAEKGVEVGKAEIPAVPLVESAPRYTGGDADEGAPVRLVGGTQIEEVGEGG